MYILAKGVPLALRLIKCVNGYKADITLMMWNE